MYRCKKCQNDIDPHKIPIVSLICWDCHTPGDRQYIKETYAKSPSIVERALVPFFEDYEELKGYNYMPEGVQTLEYDFQQLAGTVGQSFWEKTPEGENATGFKKRPDDRRRPAPGLE